MSDGMSDGYRMEREAQRRDEREEADSNLIKGMERQLYYAQEALGRYSHTRRDYLSVEEYRRRTPEELAEAKATSLQKLESDRRSLQSTLRGLLRLLDEGM